MSDPFVGDGNGGESEGPFGEAENGGGPMSDPFVGDGNGGEKEGPFGAVKNDGGPMSAPLRGQGGKTVRVNAPLGEQEALGLRAGDRALITGYVYTARDAAHRRMMETLQAGGDLPFDVRGQIIYYVGPTPSFGGHIIGSAGPTTALRMDRYTPRLHELGLRATIGKGNRSPAVQEAIRQYGAVYFAALGGTGALLSRHIREAEAIAYEDLKSEAIYRMKFVDFPAIVIYDAHGNDYYSEVQGGAGDE